MARPVALSCLVLACLALSVPVDARFLLHKHGKHHKHAHLHHGQCKTIAQVLHETPSLSRFAKAFDDAHVPFISGLVNDPHARATFLAVQDEHLGTGNTVFDEAPIRFQQHTILDRVKTCKAKAGDTYTTLAGTKLTVVIDASAHKGRKLQQVSTAWTTLLDQVLPEESEATAAAEAVPNSERPVSNFAVALPEGQPEGRPMPQGEHGPKHGLKHGQNEEHGPKHGKNGERPHGKHHGEHNDDDDHEWHHGKHGKGHGKGHGKHGHWHGKHRHHDWSAKNMVAHAISRAKAKAMAHGALYLQSNVTSQRVKVLGSVHACEGTVLLVSAFLNAPPTPDPVIVLAAQQSYFAHKAMHAQHEGGHRHHHPEHRHHHGYVQCLKHAFKVWGHRLEHLFRPHVPHHKKPCKHAKRHGKHAKTAEHDVPNDPELLAYYAAHERTAMGQTGQSAQAAAVIEAVDAAVANVVDAPKKEGRVTVYKLPAAGFAQQRLADPRAITLEEVNHMPLVLPSAADEAVREVRKWLDGLLW